jgi:hypothetical protein
MTSFSQVAIRLSMYPLCSRNKCNIEIRNKIFKCMLAFNRMKNFNIFLAI